VQGAIDLVQMRQQSIHAAILRQEVHRYRRFYHPPKLISRQHAVPGAAPAANNGAFIVWPAVLEDHASLLRGPSEANTTVEEHRISTSGSVLAGNGMLALTCDSYQWLDRGASVEITLPLPDSIPASVADGAIHCCFEREAVSVTMTDGATAQRVLRLQPLYAPVVPERSAWRLHIGCIFPVAVTGNDSAAAGAMVVAGTRPWAVRVTLCKEDSSVTWSSLVREVSPPK